MKSKPGVYSDTGLHTNGLQFRLKHKVNHSSFITFQASKKLGKKS